MPNTELSLYELSMEGVQIRDALESGEGELSPELEARLDALMLAGPDRIEAAAMVVRNLEASAEACEHEVERLARRASSFNKNRQFLLDRIAMALDCAFNGKIKTDKFTIYTQASPEHIAFDVAEGHTIDEVEAFDPMLVRVKKELNKITLNEYFKHDNTLIPPAITFERTPGKRTARIK
jgi:hypothetical protein